MQRPIQSRPELTEGTPVERNAGLNPDAVTPCTATELVYDLRQAGGASHRFYTDVSAFSDRLLDEIDHRAGAAIRAYARHVQTRLNEHPRSLGEYSIELLTLGLALAGYAGAAERTRGAPRSMARMLFQLRRRLPLIKPAADFLRSLITRLFLAPQIDRAPAGDAYSLNRLSSLIRWLQATGEFEHEATRLNNWHSFLCTLPAIEAARSIEAGVNLFHWFEREADRALGGYTRGVRPFLAGPYSRRGCREDQLFCGRQPVEYHLSMVATEIMNRGLRQQFDRKPHRVVLVPTCMRSAKAGGCRARATEMGLVCTACNPACTVNQITRRMRSLGARVYLIPHSTGFSRWLERWQRAPEYGVVAAACMLNILPGGFEMRARGIASQCVPLDYPGCQKHWSTKGISTSLNQDRLVQIVQTGASQPAR